MRHKKNKVIAALTAVLATLIFIATVATVFNNIKNNLSREVVRSLDAAAEQNILLMSREIEDKFVMLNSFAQELSSSGNEEEVIEVTDKMTSFKAVYGFKRMGYVRADKSAYTTDGYEQQFPSRVFIDKGFEGKSYITAPEKDDLIDIEDAEIVMSVPVYDGQNNVKGVVFAEYDYLTFRDVVFSDAAHGGGLSYIVDVDGGIVTSYGSAVNSEYASIFWYTDGSDKGSEVLRQEVISNMYAGKEASGIGPNSENKYFFYCYKPMEIKSADVRWYLFSVAPEEALTRRMKPIMEYIQYLIVIIAALFIASNLIYIYFNLRRRRELYRLAYIDPVTGEDNFSGFKQRAERLNDKSGFIAAVDLSEFKLINSVCGVKKGDEVLCEVWRLIKQSCREDEIFARVTADRFIVFWTGRDKEEAACCAEKLAEQIEAASERLGVPRLFPVIGIYAADKLENIDECYGDALSAVSLIKGRRDRNYAFYDELDHDAAAENRKLEESFDKALKEKRFEVWYQPKVSARGGQTVGAEALVRWRGENGELISPARFIPLFEKNGNIIRLDEYVFREVCRQQKEWEQRGIKRVPVSVNISRFSLYYSNVADKYKNIIREFGVEPQYVEIEITESAMIENTEITQLITQFTDAGFKLLLDDFGSGYSSLSTLNQMHFETIKLDKSLVDFIGSDSGEKLLELIIGFVHSIGMSITAEGVENESQLEFLKGLDCDDIQGYYFSKPLVCEAFEEWLKRGK